MSMERVQVPKRILHRMLELLDEAYAKDGVFKQATLCTEVTDDLIIKHTLDIRGEIAKNTPFYCGSLSTSIMREEYDHNGDIRWAEILVQYDPAENNHEVS